ITYGRVLFFCFFCSSYCLLRDFHSFPTRRSSDLFRNLDDQQLAALKKNKGVIGVNFYSDFLDSGYVNRVEELYYRDHPRAGQGRSEEHTSELQSRENLVCRLLLEQTNIAYRKE